VPRHDPGCLSRRGLRCGDWSRRALNGGIVQPDDSPVAVLNLGAVVIVCFGMPVDESVRVLGISFVNMLRRQGIENREGRREHGNQDCPPERPHDVLIIVT
jgi:hypothetical protein